LMINLDGEKRRAAAAVVSSIHATTRTQNVGNLKRFVLQLNERVRSWHRVTFIKITVSFVYRSVSRRLMWCHICDPINWVCWNDAVKLSGSINHARKLVAVMIITRVNIFKKLE
jgi:hypothetical protein